jgi:hypothetical protein
MKVASKTVQSEPTQIDWARLAAYIDGEGTVYINREKPRKADWSPRHFLCVMVTNTDSRLINWLVERFGGTVYSVPCNLGKKPIYRWQLNERLAAHVLRNCLSFMIMKREQAEVGVAFSDLKKRTSFRRIKVPESVIVARDAAAQRIKDLNGKVYTMPAA